MSRVAVVTNAPGNRRSGSATSTPAKAQGGYYPRGGFFGVIYEGVPIFNRGSGWEHNYWDNNLEAQPEQSRCPKC